MVGERYNWHGKVCYECESSYEHSATNYVSVLDFEYCPNCGSAGLATLETTIPYDMHPNKAFFN